VLVFGCAAARSTATAYMRSRSNARSQRTISSGSRWTTDVEVDAQPVGASRRTANAGCIVGPTFLRHARSLTVKHE
jgi:hypothetical protein